MLYVSVPVHTHLMVRREEAPRRPPGHRFAVLIAARNEQEVIGNLIDSIKAQDYPEKLIKIFVVADNCTDATARVARSRGAAVFERRDPERRREGGYALDYLLREMKLLHQEYFDGYIVLDADNVLAPDFVARMNETFSAGYDIVTCYRNSKTTATTGSPPGTRCGSCVNRAISTPRAWPSAQSCGVSGTGFLFSAAVLEAGGVWPFHLLTEDIEFTIDNVTRGMKVGYCASAVLYDEQPVRFHQSWVQRLRWSRGYMQVFRKYGRALISGIFRGSFSCYDMTMSIMPAAVLTGLSIVVNIGAAAVIYSIIRNGACWAFRRCKCC